MLEQPPTLRLRGHPSPIRSSPFTHGRARELPLFSSLSPATCPLALPVHPLRGPQGAYFIPKTELSPCVFFPHLRVQTCSSTLIYSHSLSKQL